MKNLVKSNMYASTLDNTWGLYHEYLEGRHEALISVVSSKPLSPLARKALESSFAQQGYGSSSCTFVVLEGTAGTSGLPRLTNQELFSALEGLDPLFSVITDKEAALDCSQAYRQPLPLNKRSRLFGRELRAFSSFETLLSSQEGKQKAWALLKSLPKLIQ